MGKEIKRLQGSDVVFLAFFMLSVHASLQTCFERHQTQVFSKALRKDFSTVLRSPLLYSLFGKEIFLSWG